MMVLRLVVVVAGLLVLALGIVFVVTRDRRYLLIAWRVVQFVVLLAVAFGLLYVFERVLLML